MKNAYRIGIFRLYDWAYCRMSETPLNEYRWKYIT